MRQFFGKLSCQFWRLGARIRFTCRIEKGSYGENPIGGYGLEMTRNKDLVVRWGSRYTVENEIR